MIPGVKISMGGSEYEVPPLTLGQLKMLMPKVKKLQSGELDEIGAFDVMIEVVHAAMSRNYSVLTVEQVAELIDTSNMNDVMEAVMRGSGLKLGEARAVTSANLGPQSTASSPPLADTAIPPLMQ
jgi:hypothetical protein